MKSKPIKLLIVDDEEAYRNLLSERFSMIGNSVTLAATGEEALEKIKAEPFDVGLVKHLDNPRLPVFYFVGCLLHQHISLRRFLPLEPGYLFNAEAGPAHLFDPISLREDEMDPL